MGDCKYCGENAGFLRDVHDECSNKYAAGRRAMVGRATEAAMGRADLSTLQQELRLIADSNFVPRHEVRATLSEGLDAAEGILFNDELLTRDEEGLLRSYISYFSLDRDGRGGVVSRLNKGSVIRDVSEGRLPDASQWNRLSLPFNLQKSESLVWVFSNVDYYERRTRRTRRGVSQGFSVRVMPGLYYQPRAFESESVERNVTELVDDGALGITDKHIYFSGQEKSFRVRYTRIVSFDGYSDGFGIVRDAASARPQIFVTGDGWFSYNLISNLAKRAS